MVARNSEALDVLLKVAGDSRVSWRAVELAGRGISADAASANWVISEGKNLLNGKDLAVFLIEQSDLTDELVAAWYLFAREEISVTELELRLEEFVRAIEGGFDRFRENG